MYYLYTRCVFVDTYRLLLRKMRIDDESWYNQAQGDPSRKSMQ